MRGNAKLFSLILVAAMLLTACAAPAPAAQAPVAEAPAAETATEAATEAVTEAPTEAATEEAPAEAAPEAAAEEAAADAAEEAAGALPHAERPAIAMPAAAQVRKLRREIFFMVVFLLKKFIFSNFLGRGALSPFPFLHAGAEVPV